MTEPKGGWWCECGWPNHDDEQECTRPSCGKKRQDKPKRIQRNRTKGWKMPEGAIYCGRPTKYGNDFKVGDPDLIEHDRPMTAEDAVFEWALSYAPQEVIDEWKRELAGHDLACWCSLDSPCHVDVILKVVNR